ncbi:MAG: hypothetical protein EBX66_05540 [Betaproteobacteria bacterium]|nr:hypothetical protein [Betaproteobacteria bacterium]
MANDSPTARKRVKALIKRRDNLIPIWVGAFGSDFPELRSSLRDEAADGRLDMIGANVWIVRMEYGIEQGIVHGFTSVHQKWVPQALE